MARKAVRVSALSVDARGLRCPGGGFWMDPWKPVPVAVISHAHADHARPGSEHYICSEATAPFLRHRLGAGISVESLPWGEKKLLGGAEISLHPAGHCSGSAQIRVEVSDEVWVFTGDFKRAPDPSCEAFEVVSCDTLVTEATFGVPVYRWEPGEEVARQILDWWRKEPDHPSLLFCYAFGKAQRLLGELYRISEARQLAEERGVYLHGALTALTDIYRAQGYPVLPARHVSEASSKQELAGALVLAPPSAHRSPWMKRFSSPQTGFASGWMLTRGNRRRRGYERGFVLSDHADWPALIQTVEETKAGRVLVTHGQNELLSRYLREQGIEAEVLKTLYDGESG